jgi:predicted PurR-regulated permease PerM
MSQIELPDLRPRQIVAGTVTVIAIALAFWLLYRFHQVVIIFFAALVISTAIQPLTRRLHQYGLPRPVSVVVVYLFFLAGVAGLIWALAPVALSQITRLAATLPDLYADLRDGMLDSGSFFFWRLGITLPGELPLVGLAPLDSDDVTMAARQALDATSLLLKTIFVLVALLVLTFYWTLDGQRTIRSLLLWLPLSYRENVRSFLQEAEARVAAFITGQTILCFAIGAMALVAYWLLDLPYALGLAILTGVLELVPYLGPIMAAIPAIIVGYSVDPITAVWVLAVTTVIQQLEGNVLAPRVMRRSVGVHPMVTLLAMTAFGLLFGVAGALVAIPLAAVVQLFFELYIIARQDLPAGRDEVSVLRYDTQNLVQDIRKRIRHKDGAASGDSDQLEDSLEMIAASLDHLLAVSQQTTARDQATS